MPDAELVKQVTKILFFQTIGLDAPFPGRSHFQSIFLESSQVDGIFVSELKALPPGPRNWGQFCALLLFAITNGSIKVTRESKIRFVAIIFLVGSIRKELSNAQDNKRNLKGRLRSYKNL